VFRLTYETEPAENTEPSVFDPDHIGRIMSAVA
jgi:hypothetical protein